MKNLSTLLVMALLFTTLITKAQVSGTVFRDYNGNGIKNNSATFNEPFVQGVTVKATLSTGASFSTTTNASGAYGFTVVQLPATSAVRIEFSGFGTGDLAGFKGTGNASNVQFVTANAATTAVNFAVSAPDDFWNNVTNPNPGLLAVAERRGTTNGVYAGQYTVVQINNNSSGPAVDPANAAVITIDTVTNRPAIYSQTGSLFGLAMQSRQQRLFAAAYLRRASAFGPQGPGGIYIMDKSGANFSLTGSFTLEGVTPNNSPTALNFGTVTRVTTPASSDYYLGSTSQWSLAAGSDARDIDAFAKTGTISYGDIEADPLSDKIYMMNLYQKRLIVFDGSGATATLNGASIATLATFTKAYDITTFTGWPVATGAGNNIRPYAVKIYKGKGYLGVVSDAMTTQLATDLKGYILQFDPNNIAAGFTTVVTINFSAYNGSPFKPWATTWMQTGGSGTTSGPRDYPTPIIAGIEFNEDGSMDIGIKDRWGDQGGSFEFNAVSGATGHTQCSINGDLLHACWTGVAWALEGTAGSCTKPATNTNGAASTNNFGTGNSYLSTGTEWYSDKSGDGGSENNIGGMCKLMGSGVMVTSVYDPMGSGGNSNAVDGGGNGVYWSTQGVQWSNNATGLKSQIARVIDGNSASLDKSNGMGDIEFVLPPQPIQVGNRIWLDANGDGVQDANETTAGVAAGTTVTLRSPGVDGIYGTADDQTWTTTTDAAGNYYFDNSNVIATDNRKPATWTGVTGILPGYNYRIEVNVPSGTQVTKANVAGNSLGNIDNDAVVNASGTIAMVTFNVTGVNHNFDIGFKPLATLGDKVWRDDNANGLQDAGEPGVAGITVSLFNNAGTLIGTTVTDAYGYYVFENLVAGNYSAGFTLPANYTFTTQTNAADDGNTTGYGATATSINGSDVNSTTGKTYTIVLSAGENNRNIDAGLIFNIPPITQSVGDRVWLDNGSGGGTASDGTQNGTEPGVSGINVTLFNSGGSAIATTITNANGNYLFTNVPVGLNYTVGFSLPVGMRFSPNSGALSITTNSDANTTTGRTSAFNIASGDNFTYVDAGIYPTLTTVASLGDRVWEDTNHDGVQNINEPGIGNVTVNLYIGAVLVGTTKTDPYGYYMFTNLNPADYIVEFVKPPGYTISPQKVVSGTLATDSDPNTITGKTGTTSLKAGDRVTAIDAGMYKTVPAGVLKLGDKVWIDYNMNGIQDGTEPGVAGITVTLYQNGPDGLPGTPDDVFIATSFTDAGGNFIFVNLAASAGAPTNYNIQFSNIPAGYSITTFTAPGSTTNNDSNPFSSGRTGSINLLADDLSIDAGLSSGVPPGKGTIGDKVWYDLNNNGVQEAAELGVAGVTVTLQKDVNGDGVFFGAGELSFAVTTSNALGQYTFGGLDAGSYRVVFSNMPIGYVIAPKDAAAANDNTDSDGDNAGVTINAATNSTTGVYVLAQGETNLTADLGIVPPALRNTLGDFVWFDQNNDGLQTAGEPGMPGVMVTLYDNAGTPIAYTTTDLNGQYLFAGLADGTYSVGFSNLPSGFDFTSKSAVNDLTGSDADLVSGKTVAVTLTYAIGGTSRDNRSLDAGLSSAGSALGNYVWLDANGDGVQDVTETGIAGVTVTLYASDGTTVLSSMITDQNGKYLFANLAAGSYVVGFSTIAGSLEFTQQNSSGDNGNNTNSDANPATGKTMIVVLSAGESDLTIDAGIRAKQVATVGDYVWSDLNADGVQDAGEPGIGGIVVTLFNSLSVPIGSAITDGNGKYLITNVPPGSGYFVTFSNIPNNPSGLQPSFTPQGAAGGTNTSHANASGTTNTFTVLAGDNITNIDGGIKDYPGSSVLPISYFEVSALLSGNIATVYWTTKNEVNTDKFIIERSLDNVNFESIGEKAAAGNFSGTLNYSYKDDLSLLSSYPVIYYRIKLLNTVGRFAYSKVVVVRLNGKVDLKIWPNPFADKLTVSMSGSISTTVMIRIVDYTGKTILLKQYQIVRGNNQFELADLQNLSRGVYSIQLTDNTGTIHISDKLVKK